MSTVAFDDTAVDRLAASLRGRVVRPGDPDYDQVRSVWNGMFDLRPALIAQCGSEADVVRAIDFARQTGSPVAVRAGGHSVSGKSTCEGGLVIDLSPMNRVDVDPIRKLARVQGGAVGKDFDAATQAYGLASTMGTDSTTGVAGLTLGGGIGFLTRLCGLASDNLVAADVVLADSSLVRASESENQDLLWALRGGGGNFGVVTSLEFRLHEVGPEIQVAQVFHPFDHARDVLRFYRDFMAEAPDEVGCYALAVNVPPIAPFPEPYHGKSALAIVGCHAGSLEEGEAALAPLTGYGEPILSSLAPMAYAGLQQAFDAGNPSGKRYYWKSQYLSALSDDAIEALVSYGASLPGPFSAVFLEPMGGAANRVDPEGTAFPHRDAQYNLGISAGWEDPEHDSQAIAWARALHEEMAPHSTGGVYVNYLDRDDAGRIATAYGPNWDRLRRVKASYDPDNLFNSNQNIGPKP